MLKIVINYEGLLMSIGEEIIFAKVIDGAYVECTISEATHIINKETEEAFMHDINTIVELTEIPEEVEAQKYKYVGGVFEQLPTTELIDVTNILLQTLNS